MTKKYSELRRAAVLTIAAAMYAGQALSQADLADFPTCDFPAETWYAFGHVSLDPERAVLLYQEAPKDDPDLKSESALAMYNYASELARLRPMNEAKQNQLGVELLTRAAGRGHVQAQYILALQFRDGLPGVVKSDEKSLFWLKRAAKQGHGVAMSGVATGMLLFSTNSPDLADVYFWLLLAQANALPNEPQQAEFGKMRFRQYSET